MALFPLLKTARVASGKLLSLMLYLYLLTYLLVSCMHWPPVTKFFRREILADQQSSRRKSESTNLNTIPILIEMRALLLNSSVILVAKKGLVGRPALEFLANSLS
jgi:hypothetical protein